MQDHPRQHADRYLDLPDETRNFFERLQKADIADLEKMLAVSRAKRLLWDFLLKLAGAITIVAGAVYAVTQFWKGGPPH